MALVRALLVVGRSMDGESVKVMRCIMNLISGFIWKE